MPNPTLPLGWRGFLLDSVHHWSSARKELSGTGSIHGCEVNKSNCWGIFITVTNDYCNIYATPAIPWEQAQFSQVQTEDKPHSGLHENDKKTRKGNNIYIFAIDYCLDWLKTMIRGKQIHSFKGEMATLRPPEDLHHKTQVPNQIGWLQVRDFFHDLFLA